MNELANIRYEYPHDLAMGIEDLKLYPEEAAYARYEGLCVECRPCGTMVILPLWQVERLTRRGTIADTVARMRCRWCKRPATGPRLVRNPPCIDLSGLPYHLEEWTYDRSTAYRLLFASLNQDLADAAFDAHMRTAPRRWVTVRKGMELVRSSDERVSVI